MTLNRELRGHLCALMTISIWGSTFIATKVLLRTFSPAEILLIRFGLGYLTLLAFNFRPLRFTSPRHELIAALAGLCGITIYYSFENIALQTSTASNIGVIVSAAPLFTALFARFFFGEQLKPLYFAGFATAIAGIFLMNYDGVGLHINLPGDLLALLAAVAWGIYSVATRYLAEQGYPTALLTRRFFLWGLVFMSPYVLSAGFSVTGAELMAPVNLLNLGYLSFLASAFGFASWNKAVDYLGVIKSGLYIYATPLITILVASVILNEQLSPFGAFGVVLVICGIMLSDGTVLPFGKRGRP